MKLGRKRARARLEMLPLMDIVFLLLVFFIYAMMSMAVHRALPLNLPASRAAEADKSVSLALSVRADGALYLDKEPVPLEELAALLELKKVVAADPEDFSVQVFADGSLSYQDLYRVLDQLKVAGVKKIALQADSERP